MFNIIIKTVVTYCLIMLALRAMGKKQAGQLQPYEFVITLIIAEVASTPMDGPGTPIFYGLIPALTLLLLYFLFTFISLKSVRFRRLLCGKPSILIQNGKIIKKELIKMNYSLTELIEELRLNGNPNIATVHYAILETNGQLSVLPYAAHCPVTRGDLGLKAHEEDLCTAVVLDGTFNPLGIEQLGLSEHAIRSMLASFGYPRIKNVLVCTLSDAGEVFLQDRKGETDTFRAPDGFIPVQKTENSA